MYIIPNFFLRQRKKGYIGPFKKERLLPFGGKDTYAGIHLMGVARQSRQHGKGLLKGFRFAKNPILKKNHRISSHDSPLRITHASLNRRGLLGGQRHDRLFRRQARSHSFRDISRLNGKSSPSIVKISLLLGEAEAKTKFSFM